eukprot:1669041-Prymnesium_polylepis.3
MCATVPWSRYPAPPYSTAFDSATKLPPEMTKLPLRIPKAPPCKSALEFRIKLPSLSAKWASGMTITAPPIDVLLELTIAERTSSAAQRSFTTMAPPLPVPRALASVSERSWRRAPLCSSNTRLRCCASSTAPRTTESPGSLL